MTYSNLSTQRVSIVGNNSLFDEGIARLLTLENNLKVSFFGYSDDVSFLEAISEMQPHVLVLPESISIDSVHILELLYSVPTLVYLSILVIRLHHNMIDIYKMPKEQFTAGKVHERRQFRVTKRDDLIAIVHGEF